MIGSVYSACGETKLTLPARGAAKPSRRISKGAADLHLPSSLSGTKKRTFMYSGGSIDKMGVPGGNPLSRPKIGVVDEPGWPAPTAAFERIASQPARGLAAWPPRHAARPEESCCAVS